MGEVIKPQSKVDAFLEGGKNARNSEGYDKNAEGTKSDTIAFLYVIGGKRQQRTVTQNGQQVSEASNKPIGYAFKALEALDVPECPLTKENDPYTVALSAETKHIEAGEEFQLNLVETALLLSRVEYAGSAKGNGRVVNLSGSISRDASSDEVKPLLKQESGTGSIKDGMVLAATTSKTGTAFGKATDEYTVKPEFAEKFGKYFEKRSVVSGGSAGGSKNVQGETAKNWAAAFRNLYANKGV